MPAVSFSGLASGIDGDAVIQALIDARRVQQLPFQNRIAQNLNENEALDELNTKLLSLRSAISEFRNITGSALSKVATSSNPDALAVSATSAAQATSTQITVNQLAKAATFSFTDRFTELDTPIAPGLSGPTTMELTVGVGDEARVVSVEVDAETTLGDLVTEFNEQADNRYTANVVNTGTEEAPQYALVFNSLESGTERGMLQVVASPELQAQGFFTATNVEQAVDAEIEVAGLGTITRSSNQIDGLVPGVSITLKEAGTGPVTITVTNDAGRTAEKVEAFLEALNDVISFSRAEGKIQRVEEEGQVKNIYGSLARTRVDDQVLTSLRTAMSTADSGREDAAIKIFAGSGGTIEKIDGTYSVDIEKFEEAVGTDPQAVEDLLGNFAEQMTATNGVLDVYTRFEGTIDNAQQANERSNEAFQDRIDRIERSIESQEALLRKVFANLEETVGRLNSGAGALQSLVTGLGK